MVVITKAGGEMVRVKLTLCVSAGMLESVTLKVSGVLVTPTVGVPEIAPEDEFSDNPTGSVPVLRDHVYGALPPCAVSCAA